MSLRYTGEATMDEPALRDVERWKDKIEVRLDNRQVFFLFFGSAMVACMLFVLGVIVGKRLESRGRAEAPMVEDPLAVLDRFGAVANPPAPPAALTFPRALIGGGPSKNRADKLEHVDRAGAERMPATTGAADRLVVAAKPTLTAAAPTTVVLPAPAPLAAPKPVVVAAPAPLKLTAPMHGQMNGQLNGPRVPSKGQAAAAPVVTAPSAAGPVASAAKRLSALPRPLTAPAALSPKAQPLLAKEPAPATKLAAAGSKGAAGGLVAASENKGKGRFLLQLSSFQERGEAEAFARRFAAQNAYVVATEIPGKGTWYRVRVGSYGSMQEAAAAKTNFERDHNVIAYVAGNGPAK